MRSTYEVLLHTLNVLSTCTHSIIILSTCAVFPLKLIRIEEIYIPLYHYNIYILLSEGVEREEWLKFLLNYVFNNHSDVVGIVSR